MSQNAVGEEAHEPLFVLRQHRASVVCCAFHPSGTPGSKHASLFLTGDVSGEVILWDLLTRHPLFAFSPLSHAADQGTSSSNGYSGGTLAVGFLCTSSSSSSSSVSSAPHAAAAGEVDSSGCNSRAVTSSSSDVLLQQRPARRRFKLHHHPKEQDSTRNLEADRVFFYTHCRNQCLYFWTICLSSDSQQDGEEKGRTPVLLYSLSAPQHGFCPVVNTALPEEEGVGTAFAIPHDQQGLLSVWHVRRSNNNKPADKPSLGHQEQSLPPLQDTVCEEERLARASVLDASGLTIEPSTLVSRRRTESGGTSHLGLLSLTHCTTFSAAGRAKTGAIMRLHFKAAGRIAAAFESGHVSLCSYGGAGSGAVLLAQIRAFPEAAMTCCWMDAGMHSDGSVLLTTSSEGHLHVYDVMPLTATGGQDKGGVDGCVLAAQLRWQAQVPKGLGSIAAQQQLVVAGSWDGTLRVYDLGSCNTTSSASSPLLASSISDTNHHLRSILNFHAPFTVHEVAMAPAAMALEGDFGFDVRLPRCYGGATTSSKGSSTSSNTGVYLFASCAKDGSVAVWRVDLHAMSDSGKLLLPAPQQ